MSDETFGIQPHDIYRLNDPKTRRIIGLKPTQIAEAIKRGDLPPTVALTDSGRARGWLGVQLIELQAERLAKARARSGPD